MVPRLPPMTVGGQNMDEEGCNEDFDLDYVVDSDQWIIDDVKKVCADLTKHDKKSIGKHY